MAKATRSPTTHYEMLTGFAHSPIDRGGKPSFSYFNVDFRKVWLLSGKENQGSPYSAIGALWLGRPVGAFGSALVGGYAGLRRDWLIAETDSAVYLEVLLGGVFSDAYQDRSQNLIGSFFEFHEDLRIGFRSGKDWFKGRRPFIEIGLQHISNAGQSNRNQGVNSLTVNVGIQL